MANIKVSYALSVDLLALLVTVGDLAAHTLLLTKLSNPM